jgi:methionyl-tRNA formyltransferase
MDNFIVAATGDWNLKYFNEFSKKQKGSWYFAQNPKELHKLLQNVRPKYIFFPHWSWVVSDEIVNHYECVCFHMTDLPYGRGGSPLQNLIIKGHQSTILTALRMKKTIDTGPIYYKQPMSLDGSAYDIFQRAAKMSWSMIENFILENPKAYSQKGKTTIFKRRTPEQSLIPKGLTLEEIHDYIRMLDAPGYPSAFLKFDGYRLEMKDSNLVDNKLSVNVCFIKAEDDC